MKLSEIASRIGGQIKDDSAKDVEIKNIADIESAVSGEITFISNPKYTAALKSALCQQKDLRSRVVPSCELVSAIQLFGDDIFLHPAWTMSCRARTWQMIFELMMVDSYG